MKPNKRQKLCYNCEGEVDLDVIFCPFCGTDLLEEKKVAIEDEESSENSELTASLSLNQSNNSLYPPPYQPGRSLDELEEGEVEEAPKEKKKGSFLPIICLSIGCWLFLLGALLFIFSENGMVLLRFNAKLWLTYLLLAAPLLFAGFKKLP